MAERYRGTPWREMVRAASRDAVLSTALIALLMFASRYSKRDGMASRAELHLEVPDGCEVVDVSPEEFDGLRLAAVIDGDWCATGMVIRGCTLYARTSPDVPYPCVEDRLA